MARIASSAAKTGEPEPRRAVAGWRNWFFAPAWRGALAIACVCLLVIGAVVAEVVHVREVRRQKGEMARQQVILALRIASAKFNGALREVKQADHGPREPSVSKM